MGIINKDGTLKPTKALLYEARRRTAQKNFLQKMKGSDGPFRVRGFTISDKEWFRLRLAIKKIKDQSPIGCHAQSIYNSIIKEFNDRVLGEDNDHE